MEPIYLDYNATTPVHPAVAETMRPLLEWGFGNPSSSHAYGREAREIVETARAQVAAAIGASPEEIVFTSGGTEANNFALKGAAWAHREEGEHLVTSVVEHPAVSEVYDFLERQGFETSRVPVDRRCLIDLEAVAEAVADDTILVSVMHANNEVGTIQPIAEISKIARKCGALLHTDAAQSIGKVPVNVDELGVDLLSIAGHKLYGPKGVGALYVRTGTWLEKLFHGAKHEGDRRAGTENVILVAGLGKALELATAEIDERTRHMRALRDRLHDGLAERIPGLILNGHPELRLSNTLSVSIPGVRAVDLLDGIPSVAASAGAACHSNRVHVSATLAAMGVSEQTAVGTIRFSTGRLLTEEDVDRTVELVSGAAGPLLP